ncbi:MAG: DUF938 domain-containing protein [Burkholderiaceae bacterium]
MSTPDPRILNSPSADRNKDVILSVLTQELKALQPGLLLEIASGTGQHTEHFARALPQWQFQPSDPDQPSFDSVTARSEAADLTNVRPPLILDVTQHPWPISAANVVFCANMIHISPWNSTLGLINGAAAILPAGGKLIMYGPYLQKEVPTARGNLSFDSSLRARNPAWGIRDLDDVAAVATANGFSKPQTQSMPANNLIVVFNK